MTYRPCLLLASLIVAMGCSSEPTPAPPAPAAADQPAPPAARAEALQEPAAATAAAPTAPKDPNEACAEMIVSAYKGAKFAASDVTRDKAAARARALDLLKQAGAGADFAALAKEHSEAPSTAPRGGVMGTYPKQEWPEIHAAVGEAVFGLQVHQLAAEPVEAPYGLLVVRRCPVERARARHILVRYAGAKRAGDEIVRSKDEARAAAQAILAELQAGADFATLAKAKSEDGSAKRGGDLGSPGRGLLALPFEQALFALPPGGRAPVVETAFGFHLIERPAP